MPLFNIRWLPAGLRDRVHADAWQMQTYAQINISWFRQSSSSNSSSSKIDTPF